MDGCKGCRYWVEIDPEKQLAGECHRYAPRPELAVGMKECDWPLTQPDDWCGEHAPRDEPLTPIEAH